jgi:hypothetical protein
MERMDIRELVGRVMVDREFLADLLRDPARVLADYDLSAEERAAIMTAVGRTGSAPEADRVRALQTAMLKRWAT